MPDLELIDILAIYESSFPLWDQKSPNPTNISYSFLDYLPDYYYIPGFNNPDSDKIIITGEFDWSTYQDLSDPQKNAVISLLQTSPSDTYRVSFSDVAKIVFSEVSHTGVGVSQSGDITYGRANLTTFGDELGYEYDKNNASDGVNSIDKSGIVIAANDSRTNTLGTGKRSIYVAM